MLKLSSKVFHCFIIVALVTALLPAGVAKAASDFYVRTDGADTCDGSVDAPWTDGVTACAFATMQKAIDSAANGDTINVAAGTYVLSSAVTVNKDVTLNGVGNPLIQVSGTDHRIIMNTAGATLQGFQIEKTDKTGTQNIIYVGASDLTIQNNKIWGKYEFGDGEVSRAMEFTGGLSGLTIANNEIFDIRQPGYINGVSTGTISNNYVYRTRGWVVAGGNLTFVDNTWGTGSDSNIFDIALIWSVEPTYYTDLAALAAANNGAFIEDQRTTPATLSIVYVDGSVAASGDGTARSPKKTIAEGVDRVAAGGTVHVAAGTYDESVIQIKKGMNLLGAGADASIIAPTATGNYNIIFVTNPSGDVTIDGFTFEMPEFTSYGTAIAVTDTAGAIDEHTVTISNNIIEGTANGALGTDYGFYGQGNNAKLIIANNTINKTGSNSICMEQQKGSTEVINNTISITNDVYYDPYFSMVYSGTDVTTPQIVSGNTFHLAHTGDGYSTAITFVAAANGKWANDPNDSGHFHNIQILNNIIYTEGEDGRGIGISDNSHDAVKGVIEGVLISGNTIQGVNSSDANSRGIRLEGNIQGTVIQNNEIHNLLDGVVIAGGLKNSLYPSGTVIQNNRITGNTTNLTWDHPTDTLSATPNWWGTASAASISNQISGPVTFNPYYIDAAMTMLSDVAPTSVFVDDDFTDSSAGGHTFGYDAFATIQDGINGVAVGGTVNVAAGNYDGQNKILKSVTLLGDPGDASAGPGTNAPVVDGGGNPGDAFLIENGVSNVVIQGFVMSNFTSDRSGIGNGISAWEASTSKITIQDNYFHHLGWNAVMVGNDGATGDHTNWTIKANILESWSGYGFELTNASNSIIEGNIITADVVSEPWTAIAVIARRNESGITIKGNQISGQFTDANAYPAVYIMAWDAETPSLNLDNVVVEDNIITISKPTAKLNQILIREISTGTVTNVRVLHNSLQTARTLTANAIDFTENWWGYSTGPAQGAITGDLSFSPWCADAACSSLGYSIAAGSDLQDTLDEAEPGDTIYVPAGSYEGALVINKPGITLIADRGAVFSSGLAAITIQTHDFTMLGGVIDGDPNNTGTRSNSACVVIHHDSLPLDNIHLEGVEIKNCTAGIDITSPVTNLKLISNWMHANSGDGLLFEKFATSSGENTLIQGNMFKENGGYGVRNESKSTVDASYNSWGAPTVATGNRVKGKIKASYPTYAEAFLDLQPNKNVSQVTIQKDATLTTALRVDARSLYGVEAVLHYDPDYLTYMNYAAGNFPGKGSCEVKINTPEEGDLTVICRRANPDPEANSVYTLVQLNFVANGSKLTDEDELYETSFDITAATAATRDGVNVFANNFGHGASSAWGIRTINDDNDGLVKITTESISAVNVPGFSGFVKLQGRSDNQGAKFSVFTTNNPASAFVIQTISAADGSYLGTSSNFAVRSKYYLLVDAPLYLPTTPQAAPTLADFKTLNKNNVTLKSVQLLGGDASDDNQVTLTDATCVAADYNKTPGTCNGVGSSDVNGDGEVNLLDLVMVGNSYNKTSSPWTP